MCEEADLLRRESQGRMFVLRTSLHKPHYYIGNGLGKNLVQRIALQGK